jgi:DNA-3-methyladenine glycosylase
VLTREQLFQALEGDVLSACEALLGWHLVRGPRRARIVEVEAYRSDDPGSHAFRGKTNRNQIMYGAPGRAYVYFNYGVHWMLNVTAHEEGDAAAILVRAAEPLEGRESMYEHRPRAVKDEELLSGPGKLAAAFEITGVDNGSNLLDPSSELRIEPGEPVSKVLSGMRVGLATGKGDELPWRFVDAEKLRWISRPLRRAI